MQTDVIVAVIYIMCNSVLLLLYVFLSRVESDVFLADPIVSVAADTVVVTVDVIVDVADAVDAVDTDAVDADVVTVGGDADADADAFDADASANVIVDISDDVDADAVDTDTDTDANVVNADASAVDIIPFFIFRYCAICTIHKDIERR